MSEIAPPFPVWRALLAVLLTTCCALLIMPMVTLAPRTIFWGGPVGPFFSLFFAPLVGLVAGPFIAPLTVLLAVLIQGVTAFGLTALGATLPAARSRWAWALAGLAGGAAAGTALALEMGGFGFDLPWTAETGAVTGLACAMIARAIMDF